MSQSEEPVTTPMTSTHPDKNGTDKTGIPDKSELLPVATPPSLSVSIISSWLHFFNSGLMFEFARGAYDQIVHRSPQEQEPGQREAIIAIIFSAFALEAFINELGDFAVQHKGNTKGATSNFVTTLAEVMSKLEETRVTVQFKFEWAKYLCLGQWPDRGARPYQDFALLVGLRNDLAHVKGVDIVQAIIEGKEQERRYPAILDKLPKSILAPLSRNDPWIGTIQTLAAARWACNAAAKTVQWILADIPDANFKKTLEHVYSNNFLKSL